MFHYDGKIITHFTMKDGLVSNRFRGLQEDMAGNIYFTTYEGISKFDGKAFTTLSAQATGIEAEWKKQPDDLWFVGGLDTGSVYRYDGKSMERLVLPKTKIGKDVIRKFPRSNVPNVKRSPYDVYSITEDSKGNLWFGTAVAGICRYDGNIFEWLYEDHLTNTPEGGSFGIRSFLEDKAGAIWICNTRYRFQIDAKDATDPEKGFIKYKREKGIDQLKSPDGHDHGYFMSILEEKENLWMVTYSSGVWRYDGKTATHYPIKDGEKVIKLFAIYRDNRGDLLLGTHEAGALKFNGKTFEKFRP